MIEQFRVRNYSSSITVPIDYRFLSVRSSSPSIQVEVNGIPSVCSSAANCGYEFIEMPSISDITFNYPNLTASLSKKISLPFHINELKVTVQGYVCSII